MFKKPLFFLTKLSDAFSVYRDPLCQPAYLPTCALSSRVQFMQIAHFATSSLTSARKSKSLLKLQPYTPERRELVFWATFRASESRLPWLVIKLIYAAHSHRKIHTTNPYLFIWPAKCVRHINIICIHMCLVFPAKNLQCLKLISSFSICLVLRKEPRAQSGRTKSNLNRIVSIRGKSQAQEPVWPSPQPNQYPNRPLHWFVRIRISKSWSLYTLCPYNID